MDVRYATEPAPGTPADGNEDYVVCGPSWVVVLDGATASDEGDSGCVHTVRWLVCQLAAALTPRLATSDEPLADILASAIEAVCALHRRSCDLDNPASPSSTVAMLRWQPDHADYLVLADSPLVLDTAAGVRPIIDDRVDRLPSRALSEVNARRNRPGGFWVASTRPRAAYEAVSGSVATDGLHRVALLSDGASRYVERFGLTDWRGLLNLIDERGPAELIHRVRLAELAETDEDRRRAGRRGKRHDDATVAFCRRPAHR